MFAMIEKRFNKVFQVSVYDKKSIDEKQDKRIKASHDIITSYQYYNIILTLLMQCLFRYQFLLYNP